MLGFSSLRHSGDLSDITVEIGDNKYHLHKFPLFAKSEFFKDVAKNHTNNGKNAMVQLHSFPGGHQTFELIADFCYNINIEVTKENVIELLGAAKQLTMTGDGNLISLTENFFRDCITSAKLSRNDVLLMDLLQHCSRTWPEDAPPEAVEHCVNALVDCWLKPSSMFTSLVNPLNKENNSMEAMSNLPVPWFVMILAKGRDSRVPSGILVSLAYQYLLAATNNCFEENLTTVEKTDDGSEKLEMKTENNSLVQEQQTEDVDTASLAKLLDLILLELPDDGNLASYANPQWIIKCLKIATANDCKCKNLLMTAAGEMFKALSPDDLCTMTPSVIHDLIFQSIEMKPDKQTYASSCALVDLYLQLLQDKGELTSETFKTLGTSIPTEHREIDDQLYNALECVLKAEKESLTPEARSELIGLVNLQNVEDTTLQRALDEDMVPARSVAVAALKRCEHLRNEVSSVEKDGRPPAICHDATRNRDGNGTFSETTRNLEADLDAVPVRVRATPAYTYRPITSDYDARVRDDLDYRYIQSYRSAGNVRIPSSRYVPRRHHHHLSNTYGSD